MRNKELKPEDVEASHTLGGAGEGGTYIEITFLTRRAHSSGDKALLLPVPVVSICGIG